MPEDPTKEYRKNLINFSWTLKKKQKFYIDIYKTLNNLNPSFMKEISEKTYLRPLRKQYQLNLII